MLHNHINAVMKLEAMPSTKTITDILYRWFNHTTFIWKIANILGLLGPLSLLGYCVLKVYYIDKLKTIKDYILSKVFSTPVQMFFASSLALSFYAVGCFKHFVNNDLG